MITAITANMPIAIARPQKREPGAMPSAINHAATTAKKGLRNSDGCKENPGIGNQRRAPLISTPTTSVAAVSTKAPAQPSKAKRLTPRGESSETPTITTAASAR